MPLKTIMLATIGRTTPLPTTTPTTNLIKNNEKKCLIPDTKNVKKKKNEVD